MGYGLQTNDRRLCREVMIDIRMSVLNQLFNRGPFGAKCKTCLTLAISRIKLLQNKRDMHLKVMRKEIAEFLQTGQEAIARIRVEHIIREHNTWEAYEILELFCEFVLARVPILETHRECPTELQEAVASIIFSAPRCSDLPDLLNVRNLFSAKYGKEFVAAASQLMPGTSVNRTIIEKLSVNTPSPEAKLKVLKEIAVEYNISWDSTKTENEFSKRPEDLLNGPKQIAPPLAMVVVGSQRTRPTKEVEECVPSAPHVSSNRQSSSSSSDALQKARAAIAAADRASAAARAAADLIQFVSPEDICGGSRPTEMKEAVVCPKPRRPSYVHTSGDPSLRWLLSSHDELDDYDMKAGNELLDIILSKGKGDSDGDEDGIFPPIFCGSPPSRVSNPLIQDARFMEEKHNQPILVRIEGFDCLSRRSGNCSISASA
ncbi:hypothetical protein M569_08211 [Genlisea aurea]|uniref:IST1-like protein n=1 Tax=Genlisea aurea TaxID=192259 RepID=S8CHV1_9LAMI|nr:hypothetical protein M569_08211 [Genlisea aurea]